MLPAPQIQENHFIVLKTLSVSSQSLKTFSLSKSPVYRSWREMSTWSPLEANRSCLQGLKTSQDLTVWAEQSTLWHAFYFPLVSIILDPVLSAACVSTPESWHTKLLWFLIQLQLAPHTMLLKDELEMVSWCCRHGGAQPARPQPTRGRQKEWDERQTTPETGGQGKLSTQTRLWWLFTTVRPKPSSPGTANSEICTCIYARDCNTTQEESFLPKYITSLLGRDRKKITLFHVSEA